MAALPGYAHVSLESYSEQFDPGIVKTEMDRGLAKMRVGQSRTVVNVAITLIFASRDDAASFETWYFDTIKRIGFFDWLDPRTNTVRSVRFKDGDIGALESLAPGVSISRRSATLEYLR